jgi:hypothetical protein
MNFFVAFVVLMAFYVLGLPFYFSLDFNNSLFNNHFENMFQALGLGISPSLFVFYKKKRSCFVCFIEWACAVFLPFCKEFLSVFSKRGTIISHHFQAQLVGYVMPSGLHDLGDVVFGPLKIGPLKIGPSKIGPSKIGLPEIGLNKIGPLKIGPLKIGHPKIGPPKIGPPKIGIVKIGPTKIGIVKIGPQKIGPPKIGPPKIGPTKIGLNKIGPTKIGPPKIGLPKIGPMKIGPLKIGHLKPNTITDGLLNTFLHVLRR